MSLLGALRARVARLVGGIGDGDEGVDGARCPVCGTDLGPDAAACPLCGSTAAPSDKDDAGDASRTAAEPSVATDDAVSRLRDVRDDG